MRILYDIMGRSGASAQLVELRTIYVATEASTAGLCDSVLGQLLQLVARPDLTTDTVHLICLLVHRMTILHADNCHEFFGLYQMHIPAFVDCVMRVTDGAVVANAFDAISRLCAADGSWNVPLLRAARPQSR